MLTIGKLTIRVYINAEKHVGREYRQTRGRWCTLLTKYLERAEVDETITAFIAANPAFGSHAHDCELEIKFVVEEYIS